MQEQGPRVITILERDPLLGVGALLVEVAAALVFHLHRKLRGIGDHFYNFISIPNAVIAWSVPRAYLKAKSRQGSSSWPAYTIWACILLGVVLFVVGVAHL